MKFSQLMSIVLTTLGIKSFQQNEAGKPMLTDEQKAKIAKAFNNEEFANMFAETLANQEPEEAQTNVEDMMASLRAHNASMVNKKEMEAKMEELENQRNTIAQLRADLTKLENAAIPDQPVESAALNLPSKAGVKTVMRVNTKMKHYSGLNQFLQTGNANFYSAATIDVSEISTEFGTFLSQQQNNLEIVREIYQGFTSAPLFRTVPAVTEYRAMQNIYTSVVQAFKPKWSELGKGKFTPLTIVNRRHKINVPIIPAEVLDSYMFYLYDESLSPDQMPITKWIIENNILPTILQDIEMRMIWKGKYTQPTSDQMSNSEAILGENAMDGIETILVKQKADANTKVNFYTPAQDFDVNTATDQQILDFVNGFVDWLGVYYKTIAMNILCSHEFITRYQRAYKNVWGKNSGQDGDFGTLRIDYSNKVLKAVDGMYGSPILFCTPAQNMVKLRHKNEVPNIVNDIQRVDYQVKIFGEFWLGVGFQIAEAVFAYVPDGYDPHAMIGSTLGAATDYQKIPATAIKVGNAAPATPEGTGV